MAKYLGMGRHGMWAYSPNWEYIIYRSDTSQVIDKVLLAIRLI